MKLHVSPDKKNAWCGAPVNGFNNTETPEHVTCQKCIDVMHAWKAQLDLWVERLPVTVEEQN